MRKLFLTSGIILSMVSQASASTDVNYSNNSYSASACTYPYLDTYESSSSLEAKWDANISGAITLNSNRFANSGDSTAATTANTAAALATVYSKYGTGIYSSTANATNETGAITALTTMPAMTGYDFKGFYTGKAGSGNQVINSSGNYLPAAKTQITSSGDTATWYAHWTAKNNITVSYDAGTASNPSNASSATHTPAGSTASQTATYDSSLTLAANGFTAPAGYTFNKWSSPKVLTTDASTITQYSAGAPISPWKVADNITLTATWTPINYTITYQDTTSDNMGTELYGSLTGSVPAVQRISYDNKVNLTSMTGTRTGYTFVGWSGDKDVRTVAGTGSMDYGNGESVTYLYPGNATLTAVWEPNKSGAIKLISSVYPSNNTSQTATYTTTTDEAVIPATTSTIYSVYNNGLYKSLTPSKVSMVASEEIPVKKGYTFGGFYDSGMSQQYIDANGTATDKGKRAVTSAISATWFAKWTPKQYNVIYNKGTCTYGSGQSAAYTHSNAATYDSNWAALSASLTANPKIGAPATGYTFDGWTTNSTPSYSSNTLQNSVSSYSPWKLTSDLNLYGACTPNISGAITLDSKRYAESGSTEGTAATTNASASTLYSVYDYGMYTTKPTKANYQSATKYLALATAPSLTGYTFQGFFTGKAGSGTQVINSDKTFTDSAKTQVTTAGGTTTWYAHYTTNIYTITLRNSDDTTHGTVYEKYDTGWYTNATATTAVTNNKVSVPTRNGYTFRGFYTAKQTDATSSISSGTQSITKAGTLPANNTFSADTSLYAAWARNCSAGTGCSCSLSVTDAGAVTYTTSANTGYTLNSGSSGVYNPQCTAVAKTVTYSCGDKPGSEVQTGTVPTANTATYNATYVLKANTCVYNGWTFDGWSCTRNIATGTSGTTSYGAGDQVISNLTENVTCTAKWKANTITLSWSANGGTAQDGSPYAAGSSSQSCVYDGSLTVPSAPKKDGYTFTGWTVTSTNP